MKMNLVSGHKRTRCGFRQEYQYRFAMAFRLAGCVANWRRCAVELVLVMAMLGAAARAQDTAAVAAPTKGGEEVAGLSSSAQRKPVEPASSASSSSFASNEELQRRIDGLESEVTELRQLVMRLAANGQGQGFVSRPAAAAGFEPLAKAEAAASFAAPTAAPTVAATLQANAQEQQAVAAKPATLTTDDRKILDFLHGATINVNVDTYYEYNFNHPYDEVNLLRAYDVLSNNFSLNQVGVVLEQAPDVAGGRRWGARFDEQYGMATATLQGNPSNEPRPEVYRNIFQAYGTYIVPVGKNGIEVDMGKWASSLGIEGNYTKDQMNYSRSYWFNFLPFYHLGLRVNYPINDKIAVNYWAVNGTNQAEGTNAFKDELFGFVLTPNKKLSWTVNYYYGQDHPDRVPATSCGPVPVQPGLCYLPIIPAPNGRTHIFDTYATWHPTPRWTVAAEGDYEIERLWRTTAPGESSAPSHVDGGAGYLGYKLTKIFALAGRAEYLSDRGGLFSGLNQALKETTATFDINLADGFIMRYEWRRDFSNVPTFLTDTAGVLSKDQNTATVGLIWWYGRKEGPW
jgi:hypothetical protein